MAVHYSQLQQQHQMAVSLAGCGVAAGNQPSATLFPHMLVPPPPPVVSEPVSELTCNVSVSRKRGRDEEPVTPLLPTPNAAAMLLYQQQQLLFQKQQLLLLNNQIHGTKTTLPRTDLNNLPVDHSRRNQSVMTSTSGRPADESPTPTISNVIHNSNNATSGVISILHCQSLEVDALVRLHTEKLRSVLEEARKRHCRAVLAAVGQQAQRRIAEKQAELEAATKQNVELEERLRQAAAESQAWFNVARNSEAIVASLRASLEQALLQKLGGGNDDVNGNLARGSEVEGYGDSEEEAAKAAEAPASVAAAVPHPVVGSVAEVLSKPLVAGANNNKMPSTVGVCCRACGSSEACVLLLPCRHLSLCRSCELSVDDCPVCRCRKNGSLLINLC